MMIWLMRHGIAEPWGRRPDAERALTEQGRTLVSAQIEAHHKALPVVRVVHSPYQRALETAQLAAQRLQAELICDERLTPDVDPAEALAVLEAHADYPVLYVSHNPLVGRLIGLLCEGDARQVEPMDTAMLAAIECDWPASGLGRLCWKQGV